MNRRAAWSIIGAVALVAAAAVGRLVPAPAASPPPHDLDPWSRDTMSVLGKVNLAPELNLWAVHVPSSPLGLTCVILAGPQVGAIHCDTDLLERPVADREAAR